MAHAALAPASGACVVLALGTRGDVQPLALLACQLPLSRVSLVTHGEHERWLRDPLSRAGVSLVSLASPQFVGHRRLDGAGEREELLQAVLAGFSTSTGGALLVFNLFALEGAHLAEALGVGVLAVNAYEVPAMAAPASFRRQLGAEYPELLPRWAELQHWQWALLSENFGAWRCERLGLRGPPALSTPLLIAAPASLLARPGFWPESMQTTGAFLAPEGWERFAPPPALLAFLARDAAPMAAISIGSMASLGRAAVPFPRSFLRTLAEGLSMAGCRAVLLMDAASPLAAAWLAGAGEDGQCACWPHLHGFVGSVPFGWLLPRASVSLHHAGSGSTAAALAAGVPQLPLPFMFDQFFWAEKAEHIGVAPPALRRDVVLCDPRMGVAARHAAASALAAGLRAALRPDVVAAAKLHAAGVQSEAGLENGVRAAMREAARGDAVAAAAAASRLGMAIHGGGGCEAEVQHIFREVWVQDCYLAHGLASSLPPGAVVVDVGAHVGLFALRCASLFAQRGDSAAKVLALEPVSATYEALQENTRGAACITPFRTGISSSSASTALFTVWPLLLSQSTLRRAETSQAAIDRALWAGERIEVCPTMTTLASFLSTQAPPPCRIALLKVDVEMAELDVLRSAGEELARVDACVVEVHESVERGRLPAVCALLAGAGLTRQDTDHAQAGGTVLLFARRGG